MKNNKRFKIAVLLVVIAVIFFIASILTTNGFMFFMFYGIFALCGIVGGFSIAIITMMDKGIEEIEDISTQE